MSSPTAVMDHEILAELIAADSKNFDEPVARAILRLRFSDAQNERMRQLADKYNRGELTEEERQEMESFRRVGNFLAMIQSKARRSLQSADGTNE